MQLTQYDERTNTLYILTDAIMCNLDGLTCEINRLCTLGDRNACSMLYGACARIAKAMGYKKIITYILESENGASLRASNFIYDGIAGGTHWTGKRNKGQPIPAEMKQRYYKDL